jgi:hypothetical protein
VAKTEQTTQANPSQKSKRPRTRRSALTLVEGRVYQMLALRGSQGCSLEHTELAEQGMGDETDDILLIDTFAHCTLQKELRQDDGQMYSTVVRHGSGKDQRRAAPMAHGEGRSSEVQRSLRRCQGGWDNEGAGRAKPRSTMLQTVRW